MKRSRSSERLVRADLLNTKPYSSITSLEVLSEHAGVPIEGIIKLDGNENPYGCSPKVKRALSTYPYYHIYPDPEQLQLREALKEYVGTPVDRLIAGSGSDELIDLILRLFIQPGDRVINCVPTFGMYPFCTETCGGKIVEVPRDKNFTVDISPVKKAINESTKLIFLASPNNPTGNTIPEQDVLELVKTGIMVVIDEAYYEFSGETMVPLVADYDNLIVLRTFSKWAGIAGLRVGYGIFPENIARHIMRIKQPYNVNIAAQIAAVESLKDLSYLQKTIKAIIAERRRLFTKLAELEPFKPLPSKANFILCSVLNGKATQIHQELKRRGIFVRYFNTPILKDYLRISVGKPEHTDALIDALKEIC